MFFWNLFFFQNKFSLFSKKSIGNNKVPVVKVKFVREQRIFAKGSRGPLKKRANTLLRYIKIYINSNRIQNAPPFSTALNLYGINVQKLCDDCNLFLKKNFFEDIPLVLELWITKDLNFIFQVNLIRFNNFLSSIDTRNLNVTKNFSFIVKRLSFSKEIRNYYNDKSLKEIIIRDFTLLDFWFFILFFYYFYFLQLFSSNLFFSYSIEGTMRIFLSQMFSLNYKFKKFKLL